MINAIAVLLAVQWIGELLVLWLHLPVPGPVLGMVLLLTGLIAIGRVPQGLQACSNRLLPHLMLLFIPAIAGVVMHSGRIALRTRRGDRPLAVPLYGQLQGLRRTWLPITAALLAGSAQAMQDGKADGAFSFPSAKSSTRQRPRGRRQALAGLVVAAALGTPGFLAYGSPGSTAADAAPAQQVAEHQVPDTLAQRLQACVVCHGKEGRATPEGYLPRIAGKPAGYLYNQLLNFRDGRRQNAAMGRLLAHLSDDYLREIAEHFAALELPYPAPQAPDASPSTLARGEALARQGDPVRKLPGCVECHGRELTGMEPSVPGLLGLPRDYLAGQLGAWKSGIRHAQRPDCMAEIAERLSPGDVNALVNWLSSRPVPSDSRPAVAGSVQLPIECGGVPQ